MIDASSDNAEKIALFRSLFVGREDVFARRYENVKKGISGYSPCCRNQWGNGCVLRRGERLSGKRRNSFRAALEGVIGGQPFAACAATAWTRRWRIFCCRKTAIASCDS